MINKAAAALLALLLVFASGVPDSGWHAGAAAGGRNDSPPPSALDDDPDDGDGAAGSRPARFSPPRDGWARLAGASRTVAERTPGQPGRFPASPAVRSAARRPAARVVPALPFLLRPSPRAPPALLP